MGGIPVGRLVCTHPPGDLIDGCTADEPPPAGLRFCDGKDGEGNTFQIYNRGIYGLPGD